MKVLIFLFFLMLAQQGLYAEFTFGRISAEEMNLEKWLEKYPDQPAVVIGDIGEVWFEICDRHSTPQYNLKRSLRLIVLTSDGNDYGNIPIYFYETKDGKEKVSKFKGNVYNLEEGKVKKTSVSQRKGFENDLGNNWKELVIPFPGVKAGSVIEIEYELLSDFIHELPKWRVQREIPVVFNRFVLKLPAFFSYMMNLQNQEIIKEVERKVGSHTFRFNIHENTGYGQTRPRMATITTQSITYAWESKDVSPLLPEPFTDNIENYRAGINFELMKIEYPDSPPKPYSESAESVKEFFFKSKDFGQFMVDNFGFIARNFNTTNSGNFDEDVARATNQIRKQIAWNGRSSKYVSGKADEILKIGSGNAADINLLLCGLLRQMGYRAEPVLLSTVSNGRLFSRTPTISKFNYVIVAVENLNGNWVLIDATAKGMPPGYLPPRVLNGPGMLLLPDKPVWIDVVNINYRITKKNYVFSIKEDGSLEGELNIEYSGHAKHLTKIDIESKMPQNALENLAARLSIDQSLIKLENLDDTEEPLKISAPISGLNHQVLAGSDIIFPFLFLENIPNHPFQLDKRTFPVYLGSPSTEQVKMEVTIPEGWKFSNYPKSQTIRNRDGFIYSYQVEEIDGKLIITAIKHFPKVSVESQFYGFFKNFNDKMVELHNEKIIISPK